MTPAAPRRGTLTAAAMILGAALAGFFDGILLHQVLQWHHFLSLVPGEPFRDLRVQILADGVFHVFVYLVTGFALWLLWRGRAGLDATGADRRLIGDGLIGFGLWQFADVVIFHWLIGIHRIRVDVPNPLLWDIGWLVVLGVPPLLAGLRLRRRTGPPGGGRRGMAAAAALLAVVVAAAPVAALPPPGARTAMVLFRPGLGAAEAFAAVARIDARIVWADASGELVAIKLPPGGDARQLYGEGALLVSSSAVVAGCLVWSRT